MPAPILVNQSVVTPCGENFKTIAKHRSRANPNASIWTISIQEEYDCFIEAMSYCNTGMVTPITYTPNQNTVRWGVLIDGRSLSKLGENNHCNNLVFAKFTKHVNNSEWHGYPSDYINKVQDRPSMNFLLSLKGNDYLEKSQVKKISQGKKCNI